MKKLNPFFLLTLAPSLVIANGLEYFGSSYTTSMVGNQQNFEIKDAANNYYNPSFLAFNKAVSISYDFNSVTPTFEPIKNVVTQNSSNSSLNTTSDVETNQSPSQNNIFHLSIPINHPVLTGVIGLSYSAPIGELLETDSGSTTAPEYVMYKSRYKRTSLSLNYAKAFADSFSFSLGGYLGYQVAADLEAQTGLNGTTSYGSSLRGRTKVKPTLGGIASITKKFEHSFLYLSFYQEMKSKLKSITTGEAPLGGQASISYRIQFETLMNYDPHIFRLGYMHRVGMFDLLTSVEYQMWQTYQSPKFLVTKLGGAIAGGTDNEVLTTQNIFVPKIGTNIHFGDRFKLGFGAAYRPTPLTGNFSGNGNSIDTDSMIYTAGADYKIRFLDRDINIGLSGEYIDLKIKKVTKSNLQENGAAGNKIGYPGYNIGGNIVSAMFGLKFEI